MRLNLDGGVLSTRIPVFLGAYALLGGLATLLGWALDLQRLTDWGNNGISQMPNSALGVAAAGAAVVLLWFGQRLLPAVLGVFVGLVGVATLCQYLTGVDLGIDRLLVYRDWGQRGTLAPGRMGPPGSTSLAIIGISIVLASFQRSRRCTVVGGLFTAGIASLSLIGYLFGVDTLYTIPRFTTIAWQASTMLLALGIGLVASIPEMAPTKTLLEDSGAALIVRRTLPGVILLPLVLGSLHARGQQQQLFDPVFGTALMVLVLIVLLTALLWWSASAVRVHETAMRESRARLSDVLGSITDAFMSFDATWRFVFINDQAEVRLGKRRADLVGKTMWEVFPDAMNTEAHRQLHLAMSRRTSVEYDVFHAPTERWFAERGYPTAEGGVAVFSRDITEHKHADAHLHRLAAELRDADRRKDEFLATLAHELRNPLAPIRSSLEVVKQSPGNTELMDRARSTMERQMSQMVRLIDDLLDVSRITRNKLELRTERVELTSIIHQAVEGCAPLVSGARHELILSLPTVPIFLSADPTRLAQVFGNLITNSSKYTDAGGRIWLTVERQGNFVEVSIKDTGVGIPADMLPKVFDMFTQVDRHRERAQGGLGVGLTLVKRLVELHDGTVTAESDGPGKGSTFRVRLPVLDIAEAGPPAVPTGAPAPPATRRILIVDDNQDAAETLAMLFELEGHDVQTASDGVEAVAKAESFQPHTILLDIGLPRMNGYDACRAIREQPWGKNILIVALTGWGQEEDRRKSREAGFDAHMVKPVDHAALTALLASRG